MGRGISCDGSTMINPVAVNGDRASNCPEEARACNCGSNRTTLASYRCGFCILRFQRGAPWFRPDPSAVPDSDAADTRSQRVDSGGAVAGGWTSRRLWRAYGKPMALDWLWTLRSLRPVRPEEYAFGIGRLRRWPEAHPGMPEARPEKPIDRALLPPVLMEPLRGAARACLHTARHLAQPATGSDRPD